MEEEQPLAACEFSRRIHLASSSTPSMNQLDVGSSLAQRLEPGLVPGLCHDDFHLQIERNLGDKLPGRLAVGQDRDDDRDQGCHSGI